MGATQWTEANYFPARERALFSLQSVGQIEQEEFDVAASTARPKLPGHLDHDPDLQKRANQIAEEQMKRTKRPITRNKVGKILAKEAGMDEGTVLRRIRKEWK